MTEQEYEDLPIDMLIHDIKNSLRQRQSLDEGLVIKNIVLTRRLEKAGKKCVC